MKIFRNSLFLCLILLTAFSTAFGKEKWLKVESPNFVLFGNADEKNIKKVAVKLEQFRATLNFILPKAKLNSSLPTNVYVFKNHDDFKPFKPLRDGKINENVAGYFFQTSDANFIALSTEQRFLNTYNVIFHEYFHFVMENNLDNAPIWLNEGLAEYYSTFETFDDDSGANIGKFVQSSLNALQTRQIIPLDKFFALKQGTKEYEKHVKEGIFYPQAWAIVHFFLHDNNGKRADQFYNFVSLINAGVDVKEGFEKSFQADYKQIEKELRIYLGKFAFQYLRYGFKEKINSENAFKSSILTDAEISLRKGDLLSFSPQTNEAEKFLRESLQLNSNLASGYISLGKLNLRLKQYQEARKNFQKAVELEPENYQSHYYLAGFYMAERDYEAASNSYKKAIELKNDIPRLFVGLSNAMQALESNDQAVLNMEQAIRLDPRRASYHLSQSHYTLRLGKDSLASIRGIFYIRYKGWNDESAPYAALNAYFSNRRSNLKPKADAILKESLKYLDKEIWAYSIFKYLNKEIDANTLLSLAVDNDKKTEANAYIGFDLLLDGKTEEAKKYFNWVKDNGNKNFTEYSLTLSLLENISTAKQ